MTLRMGQKATLSCESGEAYPPARLVWLLRGEVLSAGKQSLRRGNYGGKITSSRLAVRVKSRDDGDVYTCRAVNEIGEALDAVTLEIAYKPEFPVLSTPVEVMEGEPFVLNVTASASPSKLDYTWEKDNGQEKITNVTGPLLKDPREDAMFECSFDANPVMYDGIRWAKMAKANDEEVSLSPAASSRISIDWDDNGGNRVTSRLIIRNVTVQDAGKIFCLVSNGYGKEAKEETYLLVKHKPIMDESPLLRKSAAGNRDTGKLLCRAQGSPNITFTWRRQTGELAGE